VDIIKTAYYIHGPLTQWACYKKASAYGSRVGWTLARRLHPRPLTWQKEFLLFYMCQLWALHIFIKRQFFYIYMNYFRTVLIPACLLRICS